MLSIAERWAVRVPAGRSARDGEPGQPPRRDRVSWKDESAAPGAGSRFPPAVRPLRTHEQALPRAARVGLDQRIPTGVPEPLEVELPAGLDDEAIDTMIEAFPASPSPMSGLVMEHFHGEATRVPVEATAVPHREEGFNFLLTSLWSDPSTTDANVAWTRDVYAAMRPYLAERGYVNHLDRDDAEASVTAVYGPSGERLAVLKQRWDPDNVFHLNHNIPPRSS